MMTANALFAEATNITNEHISFLRDTLLALNETQLNWKKSPKEWSVKETLAHLNEYAIQYHSKFSKKIDTTRFRDPKEAYTSSPLGKSMWNSVKLGKFNNIKRKLKSQKYFNPTFVPSIVTEHMVQDFLQTQVELLAIIERAKEINIRKAKINVPLNLGVRFRFGDAVLYVVYHNQRHFQQIKTILNHPQFPK